MYRETTPMHMPENPQFGQCYVPFTQWEQTYGYEHGLERGTIFPSLDMPFKECDEL